MPFLIHHAIDRFADKTPEREAIGFLEQRLSYARLSTRSNALAWKLRESGVKRYDRVGIYMEKSIHTPVALYGIMKAGAAYVPLDVGAPIERTAMILRHCGIRCVISDSSRLRKLDRVASLYPDIDCVIGPVDKQNRSYRCVGWEEVELAPATAPAVRVLEQDPAYIIYTSGSTGIPKGIVHTHHSGLSFAAWAAREYGLAAEDRLSNHAPLHFDLSILDYFAAAVVGAATIIIPEEYLRLPPSYSKLLADKAVTVLYTVPFALIQLLHHGLLEERDLGALRWIIFGGEPMPVKHLRSLMQSLPHVTFDNIYGPAEINGCTHYSVRELGASDLSVPIGKLNDISEGRIVNDADDAVAAGEIGELLVRTPTMMQGYWGQPELNQQVFYRQPVYEGFEQVYYRTGDLVREESDGSLMFIGRKDRQIKVRGYRIELDEVESVLSTNQHVLEAAAYAIDQAADMRLIIAEVKLRHAGSVSAGELIEYARAKLPAYAVPAKLYLRDEFPRTSTGKIDRRNLRLAAESSETLQ